MRSSSRFIQETCIVAAAAGRHLRGWCPRREAWLQLLAACQDTVQPAAGLAHCRGACSLSGGCVSAGCVHAAQCAPSGCMLPSFQPGPWTGQCNATVMVIACCMPVANLVRHAAGSASRCGDCRWCGARMRLPVVVAVCAGATLPAGLLSGLVWWVSEILMLL